MKPDIETLKPGMWITFLYVNYMVGEVVGVNDSAIEVTPHFGGLINEVPKHKIVGQFECQSEAKAHAEYANAKARDFEKGVFARLKAEEKQAHRDLAELIEKAADT